MFVANTKQWLKILLDFWLAVFFSPVLVLYAVLYRSDRHTNPRVIWGPSPNKPIVYNSKALKRFGFASQTSVDAISPITNRSDFDHYFFDRLTTKRFISTIVGRYLAFFKLLKDSDVLIMSFDGGFLRNTRSRFIEHIYWRLGAKRVIVWPYGSDSFVYCQMHDHAFRYGLIKSYPEAAKKDELTRKQIFYFSKHADFVVGNIPHNESCPKWDILTVACYGVDTDEWKPDPNFVHVHDGKNGVVKIVHCPNHRDVKGTRFVVAACDAIFYEGYQIELQIVERKKNEEVREIMKNCDIVAAEFLYGYASNEIEGMSLAKPVLSNLENDYFYSVAKRYTYFKECPIVSTSPENLKDNLLRLITSPTMRQSLGKKGREYVLRYHSLDGQGLMWSKIIRKVCNNSSEDLDDWWKERANLEFEV